ncbi:MAG: heparinase II/III family protein, partial [Planctomycetales bacterium]|nr:heparinase II/III family protein [Planctomycetales bacterium]
MPQLSSTLGRVSYLTLVLGLALGPALVPALDLAAQSRGGELPLNVGPKDIPRLLKATAHVRELSEEALRAMVPQQSGLQYVDCPNCTAGNQERQLSWDPAEPNKVTCDYCGHGYPSEKYPMSESLTVHNPRGELVSFPYWENAEGYRHFFQARRDDEVRKYLASRTSDLAKLYVATQDKAHARRAAVILDQFAQVFPGWCYHFDYPFRQKEIYDGDVSPDQFLAGYRTARWTWWAYSDIPQPLVEAFDWVRDSGALEELSQELGVDVAKRIEQDLFRNAAEQVLANPEPLTNMSPNAWISLIKLGRVLGEPHYVHEPVRRLKALLESKFLYDGMWYEGAPSYARMTVGGLQGVLDVLEGYSDPAGYVDPQDGSRFEQLDATQISPILSRARTTLEQMVLPNGRLVPVHDTWAENRLNRGTEATKPYLIPALGHACLGGGSGANQTQFHLTWSGGYGHSHADNLSLLLFAQGREMLSDLGYSHTAYRSWTLATAAHNTVVIDGQNQSMGGVQSPSDGRLLLCELQDPQVQVVSADGSRAYEGLAKTYRRTLVVVDAGQGQRYAVDVFDVLGGQTHDYFLHGDADQPTSLTTTLPLAPLATLLPPGFD